MKKILTLFTCITILNFSFAQSIANWNFFGQNTGVATSIATFYSTNLDASNLLSRGATASSTTANNSFRTLGFKNDGISVANTDYFEFSLSAAPSYTLSLTTISGKGAGTGTFTVSPGVSQQYAYSIDGGAFTLIGSPVTTVGNGAIPSVDLSSIPALQNIVNTSTVTFRYYASGQTATGGWGYTSLTAGASDNGLDIAGTLNTVLPVTLSTFTGSYTNKTSVLNWVVGAESNMNGYAVERSNDGRNFLQIGYVNAIGAAKYSFTDNTAKSSINFYRLKIEGNQMKYSSVIKILSDAFQGKLNVYPSPAVNNLSAEFVSDDNLLANIKMADMTGKTLLQKIITVQKGYNNLNLDVSSLNKGIYILKISMGNKIITSPFNKL